VRNDEISRESSFPPDTMSVLRQSSFPPDTMSVSVGDSACVLVASEYDRVELPAEMESTRDDSNAIHYSKLSEVASKQPKLFYKEQ